MSLLRTHFAHLLAIPLHKQLHPREYIDHVHLQSLPPILLHKCLHLRKVIHNHEAYHLQNTLHIETRLGKVYILSRQEYLCLSKTLPGMQIHHQELSILSSRVASLFRLVFLFPS